MPGTAAYDMRTQDAVPNELEIIPDGSGSRHGSIADQRGNLASPGGMPIPKTVVEKVDPASPSHGDVPGTAAHATRKADAVPDAILKAPEQQKAFGSETRGDSTGPEVPIPRTVVTRVDSEPAHGETLGTDAFNARQNDAKPDLIEKKTDHSSKSNIACSMLSSEPMTRSELPTNSMSRLSPSKPRRMKPPAAGASPIAADGGFGPMDDDESEDESADTDDVEADDDTGPQADEGIGDEFDEFESGAENEDFGDFDDGFQQASASDEEGREIEPPPPTIQALPPLASSFVSKINATNEIVSFHFECIVLANLKLIILCPQASSRFQRTRYSRRLNRSHQSLP